MSTATSSSDRYAKAQGALAKYDAACAEPDDDPGYFKRTDAAIDLVEPLRALINPPATLETPGEIADRCMTHRGHGPDRFGYGEAYTMRPVTARRIALEAAEAGIQAAWESWEPEDAPGLVEVPAFQPEGRPDIYRDLWEENMPRVSGCMYFAIPGEQPIHVRDDQARRIMEMISSES